MVDATTHASNAKVIDTYALSPMQQGMLFHWLRDPRAGVDIEQVSCTIDSVDIPTLVAAWEAIVERHAILRTVFRWTNVEFPVQDVLDHVSTDVRNVDLRGHSADNQQQRIAEYIAQDRRENFNFAVAPLSRFSFLRLTDTQHLFVWTFPHALLDGRSFVLLVRELIESYVARVDGTPFAPPTPRPYRDFITWFEQQDQSANKAFWAKTLKNFSEPVLPDLGAVAGNIDPEDYDERALTLSREETGAINAFARAHDITTNTLVQAAWSLLLSRYTGQHDIVFGATRASRRSALNGDRAADDMIGLFINTLPVRVQVNPAQPVVEWLKVIRESQVAVREAEHTVLTDVQAASAVPSSQSLFDTMIVYEYQQQATAMNAVDSRFHHFRLREKTTFPLTMHGYGEEQLFLRLEYYRAKYSDAAVERMLEHLVVLLHEMISKSDRPLRDLEILTTSDRQRLLRDWNDTNDSRIVADVTLVQLLEECAAQHPDHVALAMGDASITYREMDARATTLARALNTHGVKPGSLVGICMERSFEFVISMIAVMKSGGAYVPLDPEYPVDRVMYMIDDSKCSVLLVQQHLTSTVLASLNDSDRQVTVLAVDTDWDRIVADAANAPAATPPNVDDLAYIIYTSGSTGRPKGAMNCHRGVVNFLQWMRTEYRLTTNDAVIQKTPASFDLSVPEFYIGLISGSQLVIVEPGGHRDPANLARIMKRHSVSVMFIVPSMLRAFHEVDASLLPPSLRIVMCSGEALPYDVQETFLSIWPNALMYNMYGPTECAVEATYWISKKGDARGMVPIGRPLSNMTIYIVDEDLKPTPIGVPGEIFIGGVQVGAGYHNRPELTAERYVPDPFANNPSARLYRTGDRARWMEDGIIEYLGRLDFQIKLRGFRIETGEIEAQIIAIAGIKDAAVVLRTDNGMDPRLVAYYVPSTTDAPSVDDIRKLLGETLPAYMVPAAFVALDAMPLSTSGKLDRKALPSPERDRSAHTVVAPRDEVETRVLAIWKDILRNDNIGVTDHFNDVGGNSLAAVRVFLRIEKEFSQELALVTILKHDTVEQLSKLLREPAQQDEWQCLVTYTSTGKGAPIFCTHAHTGNVLSYQYFAKEVAEHHPVYGVQAFGNWGTQMPMESWRDMIALYADEVVKVRPTGPYIFFGFSLGGHIALELGREMERRGHDVLMIAMHDTTGPGYPRYTLRGAIANWVLNHGGITLDRLKSIFAKNPEYGRSLRTMYWNAREVAEWWYARTRRQYLYWKYKYKNPPLDFVMPTNLTRFRLAAQRIFEHYTPEYYNGRIVYFRAAVQPPGSIHDPMNGWAGMSAEFEVHPVAGGHTDGFHPPIVKAYSRLVLDVIRDAVRRRAGSK